MTSSDMTGSWQKLNATQICWTSLYQTELDRYLFSAFLEKAQIDRHLKTALWYSNFVNFTWTGVPLGVSILRKAPFEVIPGHIIWAPDKINLIAPLSTIWIGNMNGNWWRTWRFGSHGPSLCLKNKASLFTTRSSIFSWHFTKRAGQSFFGQNSSKYSSNSGYSSII